MSDLTWGDNEPGIIYGATHTLYTPSIPGVESPPPARYHLLQDSSGNETHAFVEGSQDPTISAALPMDSTMLGAEGGILPDTISAEDTAMPDLDPFLGQIINDFEGGQAEAAEAAEAMPVPDLGPFPGQTINDFEAAQAEDEVMTETARNNEQRLSEDDPSLLCIGMALPQTHSSSPPSLTHCTTHQSWPYQQHIYHQHTLGRQSLASPWLPDYSPSANLGGEINPSQPSYTGLISNPDRLFHPSQLHVSPIGRRENPKFSHQPVARSHPEMLRATTPEAKAIREKGKFPATGKAPVSGLKVHVPETESEDTGDLHAGLPEVTAEESRQQYRSIPALMLPKDTQSAELAQSTPGTRYSNPTEPAQLLEVPQSDNDGHVPDSLLEEFMGVLELRGEQEALRFLRSARARASRESPGTGQFRRKQSSAGKRDQILSLDDVFNPGNHDIQNHALAFGKLHSGDIAIDDDPACFGITEIRNFRNQVLFHRGRVPHNDNNTGPALAVDIHIEDDLVGAAEASAPVEKFRRLMESAQGPKKGVQR